MIIERSQRTSVMAQLISAVHTQVVQPLIMYHNTARSTCDNYTLATDQSGLLGAFILVFLILYPQRTKY